MTPYEIKLQERAEAMAKLLSGFSESMLVMIKDDWSDQYQKIVDRYKNIASLSLVWSAEDFKSGYEEAIADTLGDSVDEEDLINIHDKQIRKGLLNTII